jgi:hypothetical protein
MIMINLNNLKVKARDTKRRDTVRTVIDAYQLSYNKNNTYVLTGCGAKSNNGAGWLLEEGTAIYETKSNARCLMEQYFLSALPSDPLYPTNTTRFIVLGMNSNFNDVPKNLGNLADAVCIGTILENPNIPADTNTVTEVESAFGCDIKNWLLEANFALAAVAKSP